MFFIIVVEDYTGINFGKFIIERKGRSAYPKYLWKNNIRGKVLLFPRPGFVRVQFVENDFRIDFRIEQSLSPSPKNGILLSESGSTRAMIWKLSRGRRVKSWSEFFIWGLGWTMKLVKSYVSRWRDDWSSDAKFPTNPFSTTFLVLESSIWKPCIMETAAAWRASSSAS